MQSEIIGALPYNLIIRSSTGKRKPPCIIAVSAGEEINQPLVIPHPQTTVFGYVYVSTSDQYRNWSLVLRPSGTTKPAPLLPNSDLMLFAELLLGNFFRGLDHAKGPCQPQKLWDSVLHIRSTP